MRLKGKRAIITGAGAGIGRATALKMAGEGAAVMLADLKIEAAEETRALIEKAGGKAIEHAVNMADDASVAAMVDKAVAAFGGLDILVNNAGIVHGDDNGPTDTTAAAWEKTLAVNLTGVFLGCKHAIPAMLKGGGGSIVNLGSIVALVGSAYPQIAYTAAKGGVVAMTREIAVQYARLGLRCNAVCPGPVGTELLRSFLNSEDRWVKRRRYMPMGRLGLPEEIANVIAFLASDEASYINGVALPIDGGITAAYVIRDEVGGLSYEDLQAP